MSEGYERLNEEIEKRGIKQKQMLDLLGINRQSLYFKLTGKRGARFTVEQAIIIKENLFPDVPIEELFRK